MHLRVFIQVCQSCYECLKVHVLWSSFQCLRVMMSVLGFSNKYLVVLRQACKGRCSSVLGS